MSAGVTFLRVTLKHWPRRLMHWFGKPLGFLWWDVFGFRKKVVLDNLNKAFPDWTESQKKKVGRRSVYMLMETFFEFFLIPSIDEKWLEKNVVWEGLENLDQAQKDGKGIA